MIIDLKDFESSEDEDFLTTRQSFQQQRQISTDSRKSIRFFEMDDMKKKNDNIRQAIPFIRQITQDGVPKLEVYRPTTNPIYIYTQVSFFFSFFNFFKIISKLLNKEIIINQSSYLS